MTDRLKPLTKGWQKRQNVWRHNGFMGSAKMMQSQCAAIINSETTTPGTKYLAQQIQNLAFDLGRKLRVRID